ncbi:MAG TPA: hypothetical protein VHC22_24065 [Pirellulales bacterium]|nr:hypothetical protein [Pirellulales bacterium]
MVEPYSCGLELLTGGEPRGEALAELKAFVNDRLADSQRFFTPQACDDYQLKGDLLTFASPVVTETPQNNRASCRLFECKRRDRAVLILPHWNATADGYDRLAWSLKLGGVTALRMTLPYHAQRRDGARRIASQMVSANLGRTIRSCRQAVLEARLALDWLDQRGYRRLGIIGSSLGSSIASIVAGHDERVRAVVFLLMASRFGEVVWTGRATRHIRKALDGRLASSDLNEVWSILSPISYVRQLGEFRTSALIVSARQDNVFLPYLTQEIVNAYRAGRVDHQWLTLACGHYTLGRFPYSLQAFAASLRFLRKRL